MVPLAECLKVVIAEAYQPITMSDEKPSHLSKFDQLHEPIELLTLVVEATTDIRHPLINLDGVLLAVGL